MKNTKYLKFSHCLSCLISVLAILAGGGCAGGGGVDMPQSVATLPTLQAFDPNASNVQKNTQLAITQQHTQAQANIVPYTIKTPNPYISGVFDEANKLLYQAADGTIYQFNEFTNPFMPGSGSPELTVPTKHKVQTAENGGKLLACCEKPGSYYDVFKLNDELRFGVWIDPNGNPDLFLGGVETLASDLQGVSNSPNNTATGKATYHVWALRSDGKEITSSTYRAKSRYDRNPDTLKVSKLTVNFNTGKIGGTINGNADFGADIVFQDVDVDGSKFSGSVVSGSHKGQVEGNFFGKGTTGWRARPGGGLIGGMITFQDDAHLNSVFGGTRSTYDANDTSTDLNPLD